MFSARNTDSPNPFKPALQYLLSGGTPRSNHRQSNSSGSVDSDSENTRTRMSSYNPKSSTEFRNSPIPLINISSRSPSPYAHRETSNAGSDTDDDDWGDSHISSIRQPFLSQENYKHAGWSGFVQGGGFGQWLFATNLGWTFYIAILVLWLGGCQIGLTLMNRIILWTGVYKFRYPLTTTYIELWMTHGWVLLSAYITRWVSPWLTNAGLSGMVAPSRPLQSSQSPGFRGQGKKGLFGTLTQLTSNCTGGIAGGGLFEFDWSVAKQVIPAAIIFILKLVLSNLSFTYAELPIYILSRILVVPLSLIFSYYLAQQSHSVSTISSTLTASFTLGVATIRGNKRAPIEAIVYGVLSSIFVALYPIQIQRTYKSLLTSLVPQGDILTTYPSNSNSSLPTDLSGSREEARAYWRLLHYTSVLSLIMFFPILLLSGEISDISRNCYILDIFFHWLMVVCGGLGSWAVFWGTIALTRATSPLTTTFLFIPRAAFLLPIMQGFRMPSFAWIGYGMCWACCAWFLKGRRKEGRLFRGLR